MTGSLLSASALLTRFQGRLVLPVIAAPMFRVSGPELVEACCRHGVIGAFPTANCRTPEELDAWLTRLGAALDSNAAPFCPNLIMRHEDTASHLALLAKHRVELAITSVGSPGLAIGPLHDVGCLVFADVASVRHAQKAVEAGADGLVLLSAGAGGQTGWANPFAFVRAVRSFFDGPVVIAGGIADGTALAAARLLGCDLGYMGTRFIATQESRADPAYKDMLVASQLDDVLLTTVFTGLETNMLRPSIVAAGLDPEKLDHELTATGAAQLYGAAGSGPQRWRDIWSAGHSVSGVTDVPHAAALIRRLVQEYAETANSLPRVFERSQGRGVIE